MNDIHCGYKIILFSIFALIIGVPVALAIGQSTWRKWNKNWKSAFNQWVKGERKKLLAQITKKDAAIRSLQKQIEQSGKSARDWREKFEKLQVSSDLEIKNLKASAKIAGDDAKQSSKAAEAYAKQVDALSEKLTKQTEKHDALYAQWKKKVDEMRQKNDAISAKKTTATAEMVEYHEPHPHPIVWAVGIDEHGREIRVANSGSRHEVIIGKTGFGKSTLVRNKINQLIQASPDVIKLLMIDMKAKQEYQVYEMHGELPHLAAPVAGDLESALVLLEYAMHEYKRRAAMLKLRRSLSLDEILEKGLSLPFPFLCVHIDEFAELTQTDGAAKEEKEAMQRCVSLVRRIASLGRFVGIFVTAMTQVGNADIIPTKIRSNAEVRLASRLESNVQSRSFLGEGGAESISEPGVFILATGKGTFKLRVPEVTNAQHQEQIKAAIKKYGKPDMREYERFLESRHDDEESLALNTFGIGEMAA